MSGYDRVMLALQVSTWLLVAVIYFRQE